MHCGNLTFTKKISHSVCKKCGILNVEIFKGIVALSYAYYSYNILSLLFNSLVQLKNVVETETISDKKN